ncbi:MAG TPA: hypothetical protein VGF98_04960 [Candidatus Tumulicola sp.]|jgi:hypothetical protein
MTNNKHQRYARLAERLYKAYTRIEEEVAREAQHPNPLRIPDPDWFIYSLGEWRVIFQRPETRKALRDLISALEEGTKKDWLSKWSAEHINKRFLSAIGYIHYKKPEQKDAIELLRGVAEEFDVAPMTWKSYHSLGGVFFEGEFSFGDVRCFRMIDSEYDAFLESLKTGLSETIDTEEMRAAHSKIWTEELSKFQGMPCVEVKIAGADDDEFLGTLASRKLEVAVDFLQLMVDVTTKGPATVIVADVLPYDVPSRVIFSDHGGLGKLNKSFKHTHRATLSAGSLDRMRELGFQPLIEKLHCDASRLSDLEETFMRSMHWVADSRRQGNPENSVTSAMTSIEMFFSKEQEAPITRDVSEGVAMLLGKDLAQRRYLRKTVGRLYGFRSKVSHTGSRNVSDEDVIEARNIAVNLLERICQLSTKLQTRVQVSELLADNRMEGPTIDAATI